MAAAESITRQALALAPDQRAVPAHRLLLSLEDDVKDEGAEAAWAAELGRRVAEIRAGKVTGIPSAEVLAAARARQAR